MLSGAGKGAAADPGCSDSMAMARQLLLPVHSSWTPLRSCDPSLLKPARRRILLGRSGSETDTVLSEDEDDDVDEPEKESKPVKSVKNSKSVKVEDDDDDDDDEEEEEPVKPKKNKKNEKIEVVETKAKSTKKAK
jgi:hypothetical protein